MERKVRSTSSALYPPAQTVKIKLTSSALDSEAPNTNGKTTYPGDS